MKKYEKSLGAIDLFPSVKTCKTYTEDCYNHPNCMKLLENKEEKCLGCNTLPSDNPLHTCTPPSNKKESKTNYNKSGACKDKSHSTCSYYGCRCKCHNPISMAEFMTPPSKSSSWEELKPVVDELRKQSAGYGFVTEESIMMFEEQFVYPLIQSLIAKERANEREKQLEIFDKLWDKSIDEYEEKLSKIRKKVLNLVLEKMPKEIIWKDFFTQPIGLTALVSIPLSPKSERS